MNENRKYQRFDCSNVLKAIGPGGQEIQSDSEVINVSEGGMLFYSKKELKKDTEIEVNLEFKDFHSSLQVGAKVAWVQRATERPNCYFAGVEFVDLKDSDRNILKQIKDNSGA